MPKKIDDELEKEKSVNPNVVVSPEDLKAPDAYSADSSTEAMYNAGVNIDLAPSSSTEMWKQEMDKYYKSVTDGEEFNFSLNGDALYNQYKDMFQRNGQLAMMDTLGQATALTGGYGSTYAQNLGQSAYANEMNKLNEIAPQLEQAAYDRYKDRQNQQLQNYNIASSAYQSAVNADNARAQAQLDAQEQEWDRQMDWEKLRQQYASMDADNQYKYDKLNVDNRLAYDKLNVDNQYNYDKMNMQNQLDYDKLNFDIEKYNSDYALKAAQAEADDKYRYDKLNLDNQYNYDKLNAENERFNVEQANKMAQFEADNKYRYDSLNADIDKLNAENQYKYDKMQSDAEYNYYKLLQDANNEALKNGSAVYDYSGNIVPAIDGVNRDDIDDEVIDLVKTTVAHRASDRLDSKQKILNAVRSELERRGYTESQIKYALEIADYQVRE